MKYPRFEVFISFAYPDSPIAKQIANGLAKGGVLAFFAPRDIGSGENFALEIVKAISTCDVVLLLLSQAASESPHVRREISIAVDERRRLLPFALPGTDYPVGLPPEWIYWLSAVQVTKFGGVAATVRDVMALIRGPSTTSVPSAASVIAQPSGASDPAALSLTTSADRTPRRAPLRRRLAPSALLRAELDTVPLIGREEELLRLELWAAKSDDFDARLLVGAAGQGKSRLARELSVQLGQDGWTTKTVSPSETGLAVVETLPNKPTLIVVDYAETRGTQIGNLLEALDQLGMPDRVRILLLARSTSDWWKRLTTRSAVIDGMLDGVTVQSMANLTTNEDIVRQLYHAASDGFRKALGVDRPPVTEPLFRSFSSVLDILETALADVLASSPRESETAVTSRLLAHERRYVRVAVEADGITDIDATDLDRIMALFTLFGAKTEDAAMALLSFAFAGASSTTLRRVTRLFRGLYPGADTYIYGLRPDALASDFIAQFVEEEGTLPGGHAVWRVAAKSPVSLQRGITVLTRAATEHESIRTELRDLIFNGDLAILESAIEVATQVENSEQLVSFLSEVIKAARPVMDVRRLLDRVPSETVNLASLAADLADKVVAELPPDIAKSVVDVDLLLTCSNRFSDAGWGERAANTVQQAISVLERKQEDAPRLKATLARALSNLSNRYWEIGRIDESLAPAVRSMQVFEGVLAPDRLRLGSEYEVSVAGALNNLAFRLAEVGDFDGALKAALDARQLFQDLLNRGVKEAEAGFGAVLNNLACIHLGHGHYKDSMHIGREAVALRRSQAFSDRDHYLPYVARTLANTASSAMAAGEISSALSMIAEARALHSITGRRASIFRYEEAESATISFVLFAIAGERERAEEALDDARRLVETIKGQLSQLTIRLTEAIMQNALSLRTLSRPTWQDVSTGQYLDGQRSQSSTLTLPILLEYKDL